MVKSLRIKKKLREEWFRQIAFEINEAKTARSDWLSRMRQSYDQYRNILPVKSRPWPGCSNLQPPLTTRTCEQIIRRLVQQLTQSGEYVYLAANTSVIAETGRSENVQEFLRWQGKNELNYFDKLDSFIRQMVIGGTGVMATEWCKEERMVADRLLLGQHRYVQKGSDNPEPQFVRYGEKKVTKASPIDDILKEVFGSIGLTIDGKKKRKGGKDEIDVWDVRYSERGIKRKGVVMIDTSEELGDDIEVIAEFKKIVKDQPIIRNLDAENVIVTPGDHCIQDAPLVAIREFVNADFIEAQLESGAWHLDSAEKTELREKLYGSDGKPKTGSRTIDEEDDQKRNDDDYLGLQSETLRGDYIPVFTIFTEWDLRDDDELAASKLVILPRHNKLVYAHYDSVDNRSGMRNLVSRNFLPVRNEFYGLSLPQLVRSLQTEINTIHNQSVDRDAIINNPMVFIDPSSNFDRDNVVIGPGEVIPVMNPQESVLMQPFPVSSDADLRRTAQLIGWGDELTTIGSLAGGQSEARPNAQRTARGAQLLLAQTSQAIEYSAESVGMAVVDLWKQIYSWNASNIKPGKEFRIMGSNEVKAFETREDFRGDFDFGFDVGKAVLNDEVRRFMWTEFFQLTAAIAAAPPEQVPRPLWESAVQLGKHRGIPNPEKYLPDIPDTSPDPLSPFQEHEMFLMGRPVSTHPQDPIQLHLEEHAKFGEAVMDPESQMGLSPSGLKFYEQHMMETIRQFEEMQRAQAGQQLGGPFAMGQNAMVPAGPGQPPPIQPEAAAAGGGDQAARGGPF